MLCSEILNCSHWKIVTFSSQVFTVIPDVILEGLILQGEKVEMGEEYTLAMNMALDTSFHTHTFLFENNDTMILIASIREKNIKLIFRVTY